VNEMPKLPLRPCSCRWTRTLKPHAGTREEDNGVDATQNTTSVAERMDCLFVTHFTAAPQFRRRENKTGSVSSARKKR
jgi:hypothetical protein